VTEAFTQERITASHPRCNAATLSVTDEEASKGGCSTCFFLFCLDQARLRLDADHG
jgi:hypothetical protein